ncbi:hypothetical protein ABT364_02775 [Massilia sp. SR12]
MRLYYGDLLAQARADFREDQEVQRAVPVGIPGVAYPGDWEREKAEVAAFDWAAVQPVLTEYVKLALVAATPLRRVREADARDALFAHFKENRVAYTPLDTYDREELVALLMSGAAIEHALANVLEAKAALA